MKGGIFLLLTSIYVLQAIWYALPDYLTEVTFQSLCAWTRREMTRESETTFPHTASLQALVPTYNSVPRER